MRYWTWFYGKSDPLGTERAGWVWFVILGALVVVGAMGLVVAFL